MKRVLVTGAAGFIGRQTLGLLRERGYEVHAADRSALADEPVRWHAVDLLDARAVSELVAEVRPTHVLQLAWCTAHGEFWQAPVNVDWVTASLALMNAAIAAGAARIVGAGSCAEYDWSAGYCVEDETPLRPATLYGTAKHAYGELLLARARQAGIHAAWGRIFLAYGPFENPARLVPSVIRALLRGERAACTSGEQVRDILHVTDVARAFVHLLDAQADGAFNVSSDEPVSVKALVEGIAQALGRPELLALGALPTRSLEPKELVGSALRLREIGYAPSLTLTAGLTETIAWWRRREEERAAG